MDKGSPEKLTAEERAYYRETWGFDPVTDRIYVTSEEIESLNLIPRISYYYQVQVPLENDTELKEAGVNVYARVEVDARGASDNRILFTRGNQTAEVECVHTVVFVGTLQEFGALHEEKIKELTISTEARPAILPSWEHFAALKSYVGGICSIGFLSLLDSSTPSDINPRLLAEVSHALIQVAPEVIFPRVMPIFENLVENSPKEWLIKNWDFCNYAYSLYTYLTDPDFVDSLENGVRSKLFDVLLVVDVDSYAEDQHIEILVNFLTEDFVQTLPIATQHKLLEMFIEEIFQSFPDRLNLSSLVVFLTELALMREDEYLISPKVLKHMSSIYQICGNTMPEFFLDISVPYLHRLLSTFFQIWEKDRKPDQNPLPYWIVRSLLTKTEDIYQGEELLRRVIKHTPTIWGYEFSLLIQDIKWIPCFLLRAGIDWKREFLRQEALIDIYNDDDDDVDFDEDEDEDEDEDDYEDFEEEDAPTNQWWQKIQLHFQKQK